MVQEPPVRTLCIPDMGEEENNGLNINSDEDSCAAVSGPCLSVCVSPAAKTLVVVTSHAWLVRTPGP